MAAGGLLQAVERHQLDPVCVGDTLQPVDHISRGRRRVGERDHTGVFGPKPGVVNLQPTPGCDSAAHDVARGESLIVLPTRTRTAPRVQAAHAVGAGRFVFTLTTTTIVVAGQSIAVTQAGATPLTVPTAR